MATRKNVSGNQRARPGAISALLKATRVLPGESLADYRKELQGLFVEFDADTPLKVCLVENIHR